MTQRRSWYSGGLRRKEVCGDDHKCKKMYLRMGYRQKEEMTAGELTPHEASWRS